jgi:hypothetical protein
MIGRQITTRRRIKIEIRIRAFFDRLLYQAALLFCHHRKHKHCIRKFFARHAPQLSNADVDVPAKALITLEALMYLLRISCVRALSPSKHCLALRPPIYLG